MKTLALLSFAILTMFFTCDKSEVTDIEDVEYIAYGTYFGECLGYCKREVVISGNIVFTKSGWGIDGSLPDSSCSMTFLRNPLPDYVEMMDLNEFKMLDTILGCPDCADGGAEWLELSFEGDIKRVTFEYMNEPDEIKFIIEDLRDLMLGFEGCGGEEK